MAHAGSGRGKTEGLWWSLCKCQASARRPHIERSHVASHQAHQSRRSPIAFGRVGPRSLQPLQPASQATDNDMASAAPGQPYWGTTEVYDMRGGYSRLFSPSAGRYSLFFVRVTLVAGRLDSLTPFVEASNGFKTLSAFVFALFC